MARTIDLTGDDDALDETLSPHDPRRRAVRGDGKLRGADLRAFIKQLAADGVETKDIVEQAGCSRAYVRRVLTTETTTRERIPADLLARMVAELRDGVEPAALLDKLPEIAGLFVSRSGQNGDDRQRVLSNLRTLISSGGKTETGPARELHEARQAGKLKARA